MLSVLTVFAALQGCSDKPAYRLAVDVANAEVAYVAYASAIHLPGADAFVPALILEDGVAYADIPESDSILWVRIEFKDAPGTYQSLPFFLMPGEKIRVTGEMHGDFLNYDIAGSPAFEEWVRHRRETYMEYERRLAGTGFDPCAGDTFTDEAESLLARVDSIKLEYIKANPESELSALYYTGGLGSPEVYGLLGEKLRKGRYKPLLDHWLELGRRAKADNGPEECR